ncbi:MAG TPA: type II secretion system protein [Thermoanaerobaculia bacterium]|nr:type II secretion system protein [Thermoanaerobaculia bacterium]
MRKQRGYTLVAIVIGIAILTILTAAVAPAVSVIMQRDREDELIFRGKQYARGITLFQRRYGRLPTTLKEMYENRPRTLRKLWKEPMCGCDDWYLIIQGTPDALPTAGIPGQPQTKSGAAAPPPPTPGPQPFGSPGEKKNVGPIIGVRSKVKKQSLQEWRGQRSYNQWPFIAGDADRDMIGLEAPPFVPGPLLPRQPPSR